MCREDSRFSEEQRLVEASAEGGCKLELVVHRTKCACYCEQVEFESIAMVFRGEVLPPLKIVCQYCGRVLYNTSKLVRAE